MSFKSEIYPQNKYANVKICFKKPIFAPIKNKEYGFRFFCNFR